MEIIHKNQTQKVKNSDNCLATEYPMADKDIDGAVVEITGRYPGKGRVVNSACKELAYIINGFGKIVVDGEEINLNEGDCILIEPGEKFFWQGDLKLFISSTPAWNAEQSKEVE